jgi:hypothetical protein
MLWVFTQTALKPETDHVLRSTDSDGSFPSSACVSVTAVPGTDLLLAVKYGVAMSVVQSVLCADDTFMLVLWRSLRPDSYHHNQRGE